MLNYGKIKGTICTFFFARRDIRWLTCFTAKYQEDPTEPLQEIDWRSYSIRPTFQFWSSGEMLVKKLGVNALLQMSCRLRFSKSFQSDEHFYCDLNSIVQPSPKSKAVL